MRALKIAGIVAAALAVVILVIALWINAVAGRRLAQLEAKVKVLHEEVKARDTSRPPRGPALPGNAWEDYQKAFADLDPDKEALKQVDEFIRRSTKADRAKAEAAVAAHGAALDNLRRGVRRERGDYANQWEQGVAMELPGLQQSNRLSQLAAARARFLVEEGKPREAADLLLDVCQFARDQGYNATLISEMIAIAIYGLAVEELRDIVLSGRLTRDDLLEVERALEGFDRTFPKSGHSLLNESLWFGYQGLQAAGPDKLFDIQMEGGPFRPLILWRYGFSERIAAADAFDAHLAAMRRMAGLEEKSWADVTRLSDKMDKEYKASPNPLVAIGIPGLGSSGRIGRERRAQLRLLRTAARYRATGEILELDDPFGVKLLHAEKDGKLRIWSVGRDGSDHGGTGDWKPQEGKDILLETGK